MAHDAVDGNGRQLAARIRAVIEREVACWAPVIEASISGSIG
jgi:hypothetical protein